MIPPLICNQNVYIKNSKFHGVHYYSQFKNNTDTVFSLHQGGITFMDISLVCLSVSKIMQIAKNYWVDLPAKSEEIGLGPT